MSHVNPRVVMVDASNFTPFYDHELSEALQREGADVTLYHRPERSGEARLDGSYRSRATFARRSEELRQKPGWSRGYRWVKAVEHLSSMSRLKEEVLASGVDVVHFQWLPLPALEHHTVRALGRSVATVLTVHDSIPLQGAGSALGRFGWRRALRPFDRLIVHTHHTREQLCRDGFDEDLIARIPMGALSPRDSGPAPLAQAQGPPNIVCFGQIKPYKGVDVLIRAFARLPQELRAGTRLRVVGRPAMPMAPLFELAEASGVDGSIDWDLRFIPEEEISALLRSATIIALPYRQIDGSAVLATALRQGRPIVASRAGGIPEILTHEVDSLLFEPGDDAELAVALERILVDGDLAGELGGRAAETASKIPPWDEIARRTLGVYEAACRSRLSRAA